MAKIKIDLEDLTRAIVAFYDYMNVPLPYPLPLDEGHVPLIEFILSARRGSFKILKKIGNKIIEAEFDFAFKHVLTHAHTVWTAQRLNKKLKIKRKWKTRPVYSRQARTRASKRQSRDY